MLQRGWLQKQRAAQARMNARADWMEIDAGRQAHFAEVARREREAAERRHAERNAKVRCPCCDSGTVTVELAERVISALARLPAGTQPDAGLVAKLLAAAVMPDPVRAPVALPPVQLDPVIMGADDEAPADDQDAIAAYRAAADAPAVVADELAAVESALEADAQDVVVTATPAPVPAPDPVQPRKHRGRRSAPLPFMDGGA